jgi:hypothetical protein
VIDIVDDEGNHFRGTPLFVAASWLVMYTFEEVLEGTINLDTVNAVNPALPYDPAIHFADEAFWEDEDDGVGVESRRLVCHKGGTALIAATRLMNERWVGALLDRGADASILDPRGESVWWALFFDEYYFTDSGCEAARDIALLLCERPDAQRVVNVGPTPPLWRAIQRIQYAHTEGNQEAQG